MKDDEDVLVTKTGGDGEATGEIGGRPVFAGDGSFPPEPSDRPGWERGVDGEGQDAGAGARDGRGVTVLRMASGQSFLVEAKP